MELSHEVPAKIQGSRTSSSSALPWCSGSAQFTAPPVWVYVWVTVLMYRLQINQHCWGQGYWVIFSLSPFELLV